LVAISVIAEEFLRKFGGDSIEEIYKRWKDYMLI
jgi:chorismate synthase